MSGRGVREAEARMTKKKPRSKSSRAGLTFPVSRLLRYLRLGRYAKYIGAGAPIYLTAVLEYLVAEMLELSGSVARDFKKLTIKPRHVLLAIKNDEELDKLLQHVTISEGGVVPYIQPVLLPVKIDRKKKSRMDRMDV